MKRLIVFALPLALIALILFAYTHVRERASLLSQASLFDAAPSESAGLLTLSPDALSGDSDTPFAARFRAALADDEIPSSFLPYAVSDVAYVLSPSLEAQGFASRWLIPVEPKSAHALVDSLAAEALPQSFTHRGTRVDAHVFADESLWWYALSGDVLICAAQSADVVSSLDCLLDHRGLPSVNPDFARLASTSGAQAEAHLFLHLRAISNLLDDILPPTSRADALLSGATAWLALDVRSEVLADAAWSILSLSGYAMPDGSMLPALLSGQGLPEQNDPFLPSDFSDFFRIHLSDYQTFADTLQHQFPTVSPRLSTRAFLAEVFTGDALLFTLGDTPYASLSIDDSAHVALRFDSLDVPRAMVYSPACRRNIGVYTLPESLDFTHALGSLFPDSLRYAALSSEALWLAPTQSALLDVAARRLMHKGVSGALPASVCSFSLGGDALRMSAHTPLAEWVASHPAWSSDLLSVDGRVEPERDLLYCGLTLRYTAGGNIPKASSRTSETAVSEPATTATPTTSATELWKKSLTAAPVFGPVVIRSQTDGSTDVLIQTADFRLSSYSLRGALQWSVPLDGAIASDVAQLDFYKNGKFQYLFHTSTSLYLVDRKGRFVAPYPVKFPARTAAACSVFDYDGRKDYRIFVPLSDGRTLLYDKTGRTLSDWQPPKFDHITAPVQYSRSGGKDFVVLTADSTLRFLTRRGVPRFTPSPTFTPLSGAPLAAVSSGWITPDTAGRFCTISPDGKTSFTPYRTASASAVQDRFVVCGTDNSPVLVVLHDAEILAFDATLRNLFTALVPDGAGTLVYADAERLAFHSPSATVLKVFTLSTRSWSDLSVDSYFKPSVLSGSPSSEVLVATSSPTGFALCKSLW